MKKQRNALVIVDPQNDFCDHRGSLYVDGAFADIKRLAAHIADSGERYSDILVSLDSHDVVAIFHPMFWQDKDGARPEPFTEITQEDILRGRWRAASPENQAPAERTFKVMAEKHLGALTVWPEHCVVSTWGYQVCDTLKGALAVWRARTGQAVRFVFKGETPYTDQFSIFEGVDDSYPETVFNETLFRRLSGLDSVTFAGEALSHCVGESALSYMNRLASSQDVTLLADCTSPVAGFNREDMLGRLAEKGVRLLCIAG